MQAFSPAPNVPRLDLKRLPDEEHENALHLQALLHLLDAFIVRFESALRLNNHCRGLGKNCAKEANSSGVTDELAFRISEQISWRLIAAREAAMAVYHFSCTLESIASGVHRCPSLKSRMKHRPFQMARKIFNKIFPHADSMRHAISHAAELAATVQSLKENAAKSRRYGEMLSAENVIPFAIGPSF